MEGSSISIFSESYDSVQSDVIPNSHDLSEAQTQDGSVGNVTPGAASAQGQNPGSGGAWCQEPREGQLQRRAEFCLPPPLLVASAEKPS